MTPIPCLIKHMFGNKQQYLPAHEGLSKFIMVPAAAASLTVGFYI